MPRDFTRATPDYYQRTESNTALLSYPWSMAVWFKPTFAVTQDAGEWTLWDFYGSGTIFNHTRIDDGAGNVGTLQAVERNGGLSGVMATSNAVTINTWHHAFVRRSDGEHKVILDGDTANAGSSTDGVTSYAAQDQFYVGTFDGSTDHWDGLESWLVFWNAFLTDEEAAALAAGVHPMRIRPSAHNIVIPFHGFSNPETMYTDINGSTTIAVGSGAPAGVPGDGPPMEMWQPYGMGSVLAATAAPPAGAAANQGWGWCHT